MHDTRAVGAENSEEVQQRQYHPPWRRCAVPLSPAQVPFRQCRLLAASRPYMGVKDD